MKLQIKSDLHNEFWWNKTRSWEPTDKDQSSYINPEADVIILAGDIASAGDSHRSVPYIYKDCGKPVIYVPGNHEYYGGHIIDTKAVMAESVKNTNIHLLNPGWVEIGDVIFIGATLWSYLASFESKMLARSFSDIKHINGLTAFSWNNIHLNERKFIKDALIQFKDKKKVVVTHHMPSLKSVPARFLGHELNDFFVSNQESLMVDEHAPVLWVHGHTHDSFDYEVGNCRVVCNPHGYWQENSDTALNKQYDNALIVEV